MRASTRRRITIALIALLVLVLIGWFLQGTVTGDAAVEQGFQHPTELTTDTR